MMVMELINSRLQREPRFHENKRHFHLGNHGVKSDKIFTCLGSSIMSGSLHLEGQMTKKYNLPLSHLDYKYIETCKNPKEIEKIVNVLRSGDEGKFPDLERFAEKRLQELNPKSRTLRKDGPILRPGDLSGGDWKSIEEDLKNWTNTMHDQDPIKPQKHSRPADDIVEGDENLPPVRSGNVVLEGKKDQFKYLGSLISSDGRNNSEVASRIAQAKTNFQKMKTVLTNKNISIRTRRRALECYIEPILMYGCEAWTISKQTQKKLEATEMWFLRRMLRISWTAKKTNDTVLEEAHTTRLLISKIRKRQATFFGHVMRREKLENLVTTGMLERKRSRGKQREKLIEGLADWLKAGKSLEAIEATKDRKKWRTMIANAVKQGT
ncbi:sperm-associated antigen 1 [Plakobranchus ocellatus]|uniref:Sperm-associated antigen 1 n=1 Tax=Plakobranchus ocellatus TaxID=259542 RepID=A0AAV4D1V8_9GAST|nr:sperm-associated antigen 1 [Plakobranchus ocellatus]